MRRVFVSVTVGLAMASGSGAAVQEPAGSGAGGQPVDAAMTIRVATFNVEDIRTDDLKNPDHPRLGEIAAVLQRLRPNVILINEIAYDEPGSPGFVEGDEPGQNGRRLIENFLSVAQGEGLLPLGYRAFMAPSNTGRHSGFDLNNDGEVATVLPDVPAAAADGSPGKQTDAGRVYGNDCWGFGTFPGQYGMALLVDERLTIVEDEVRTFGKLAWDAMPRALMPVDAATGEPWYDDEERSYFRLSSKSHWDVPVKLPNGAVVHFLASHPTPPAFDGDEQRNIKRNHDEIRFWADYIGGAEYIVDDAGRQGALGRGERFVVLGDLNADPDEGASLDDPVGRFLLRNKAVQGGHVPRGEVEGLDDDDTARWGLRVDYVLPSVGMEIGRSGIWREGVGSDHFPVWVEVAVPGKE